MMAEPRGAQAHLELAALLVKHQQGDMEERGRLPGSTRFATGRPAASTEVKEKSVSWLLSR